MAQYIIPAASGKPLTASGNAEGGLDIFDSRGMLARTLRASYVNECGGALAALDDFYTDADGSRWFGPARIAEDAA